VHFTAFISTSFSVHGEPKNAFDAALKNVKRSESLRVEEVRCGKKKKREVQQRRRGG
jgi:hypothetical protein